MVIIDPLNFANNTTRNTYRINEIKLKFSEGLKTILRKKKEFMESRDDSFETDVIGELLSSNS